MHWLYTYSCMIWLLYFWRFSIHSGNQKSCLLPCNVSKIRNNVPLIAEITQSLHNSKIPDRLSQRAMGTNWNMGGSLRTSGNAFLLWGWLSTRTGYPGRLWSLHPWRHLKHVWTRSRATRSRCPCMSRELDQMTSRGLFHPQPPCDSVILWMP